MSPEEKRNAVKDSVADMLQGKKDTSTGTAKDVIVRSSGISALDGQESLAKTLASNIDKISDMEVVSYLSNRQAYTLGAIAGMAEIVTEKVSLDTLLDKTSLDKSAWGYVAKNMLAEGSEEMASDLINWAEESGLIKDRLAREALEILQNVSLSAGPLGLDTESGGRYDEQREIQTGGLTDGGEAAGLDAGREARDRQSHREILWREAGTVDGGGRTGSEGARAFVERAASEGKIVRKTGKQGHYAYRVTLRESYTPATQEAMEADREWGLGATVVDSFERNDGQRTFRGMEATTGPEGQVFLVNGCSKEAVGHEGLHSGLRRSIPEAKRFLELTQEIEITTDKMEYVLKRIKKAYYDEGGREFDFEHLKEETAAFLSGMIESGRAGKVFGLTEENSPELYTAWRQMKQAMGANPMLRSGEGPGGEGESRFLLGEIEGLVSKSPDSQPSLISDQALNELMNDQSFLDFLKRKGDLKLTKDMTRDRKRTTIREALGRAVQKKNVSKPGLGF